jgi:nicotinamidase/pyrazinamidase
MKTILYDCDNQNDFYPGGALAVEGADVIRQNLAFLTQKAIKENINIISTMDTHTEDDPEFKIFPPHCIKNKLGWTKIPETVYDDYIYIERLNILYNTNFGSKSTQVILEKATYNIWDPILGQPDNLNVILKDLDVKRVIMTGVATNICVKAAVMGLLERHYEVYLVQDAIKGLFVDLNNNETVALLEMIKAGAVMIKTENVTFN